MKVDNNLDNVLVVLLNYNSNEDTVNCLKSLQLSLPGEPAVVLVDNASKNPLKKTEIDFYKNIHLINNKENIGFGCGNNVGLNWGLSKKEYDYFFILNNDTIVNSSVISVLIDAFKKDEKIGVTTSLITYLDNPNIVWFGGCEVKIGKGNAAIKDFNKTPSKEGALKNRFVTFASGCAMMVKREVLEKVGMFDDRFFMYVEDLEYCFRIRKAGYKLYYTSDTKIFHKVHGSTKKEEGYVPPFSPKNPNLPFFIYHFFKNSLITMHTHLGLKSKIVYHFKQSGFACILMVKYILARRTKAVSSIFRAYKDFIIQKSQHPNYG